MLKNTGLKGYDGIGSTSLRQSREPDILGVSVHTNKEERITGLATREMTHVVDENLLHRSASHPRRQQPQLGVLSGLAQTCLLYTSRCV